MPVAVKRVTMILSSQQLIRFHYLLLCSVRTHVKFLVDGLDRMTANPREHVAFLPKLQQLSSRFSYIAGTSTASKGKLMKALATNTLALN